MRTGKCSRNHAPARSHNNVQAPHVFHAPQRLADSPCKPFHTPPGPDPTLHPNPFAHPIHPAHPHTPHIPYTPHLEDNVLGRGPAAHLACQLDADHLGRLELPRQARHHVHRVRAAHAHGAHAQAASVGRVAVRTDHHQAGQGVVLQHDLCGVRVGGWVGVSKGAAFCTATGSPFMCF